MKHPYKIRLSISIIVFIFALLGLLGIFYQIKFFDVQFAPLLQRVLVDFSFVATILLIGMVILTLLFGRFYCSVLCPFGALQEIFAFLFFKKRKNKHIKNYPVKYFIAAVVFGVLVAGSVYLLRYIEPYTYFGSAFSLCALGGAALAAVIVLTFFKNRFFCTNICPVGALLGLISKLSLNKIYIQKDTCVSCGNCEKVCPSGCINYKEKDIDNETCIRCLKCLEACPKGGIKFSKKPKEQVKFSLNRRKAVIGAAALALFGVMIKAGIEIKDRAVQKIKDVILPPGAQNGERLVNTCFNCNLCVENCPNKIIVRANNDFEAVHIDYSKGYCEKDCNKCGEVCPTGAIKRLSLEDKQKTRIAMAAIKDDKCSKCGACAKDCPYGAIEDTKEGVLINALKCIGCGKCKSACGFDTIEIFAVKKQSLI